MRNTIKTFLAKHPYFNTAASAAAGYYGGPAGAEAFQKVLAVLGLA